MSVLADRDIRAALQEGRIRIDPYDPACLQPSSVDLHLDREFRVFRNNRYPYIDPRAAQPDLTEVVAVEDEEAFILHPGEFVLGQTLEWVELPDDVVARLEGKALALDTPVPTPTGWRTMGDLEPGELVFDEHGVPTRIVAATAPLADRPCREVIFSDGQRVVADASHQWLTLGRQGHGRGRMRLGIRTTDEIARSLRVDGEPNHHVPLGPVQHPSRIDLPIEPDALGAWPGVGTTTAAAIGELAGTREALADGVVGLAARPAGERPPEARSHRLRAIDAVREVPSVPVRCIQVASPRGLFLVSRSFIPTHNSSLGRLGLLIHSTAGYVDPGWKGNLTLELSNVANLPIALYFGMRIGQISFFAMSGPVERPYGSHGLGSKYQGQSSPTASASFRDFEAGRRTRKGGPRRPSA